MKFSTLMLAASTANLIAATPSSKKSKTKRASGFQWFGSNESGAEFGTALPGELGKDYTFPDTSGIQTLIDDGLNIFRVPFLMERAIPGELTGTINETYWSGYQSTIEYITSAGAHAIVDPHNYGRYYGNIINSTSDFAAFWTTIATYFVDNELVIFDTNNEYNTMEQTLVVDLNQAAINAIRATGATSQYIFAEGNSWTGAWTWTSVNPTMGALTDPSNKLVFEMHQYLDSDGSGTSTVCVNNTIGLNRVQAATQWLIENNKVAFLGEFAAGNNSVCSEAVTGMLTYLEQNSDVWLGAEWWSAGPWWGDYIFSFEPTTGYSYEYYLDILKPYFAGGSGGSSPTSSSTTTTATSTAKTTTTKTTTTTTTTKTTTTTTTSAAGGGGGTSPHWGQCGGVGYAGPTTCVSPYTCQELNAYYYQCL